MASKESYERGIYNLREGGIYCITDEDSSRGISNIEVVEEMLASGIRIIQYRAKDKTAREKYSQCLAIRNLTKAADCTFIVDDDVEIAMMVEADGIHVGQTDLPVDDVRRYVGADMILGLSTHEPSQALDAIAVGADYIGVGPIFPTKTKKNVCDPVGLTYLDYVVKNIDLPFVAIGGIKAHNLTSVIEHGAKTISLVTEITAAEDIPLTIKNLYKMF